MRAREFTINVPITISISGDKDPVLNAGNQIPADNIKSPPTPPVKTSNQTSQDDTELQQNPIMVNPQQQELELKKAAAGKSSPVIDKLTQNQTIGEEPPEQNEIIRQLRALMAK
jgi:hypothetical protein